MGLKKLVLATRSVRRFREEQEVSMQTLEELVDLARHTASAGNFQPLKYVLCTDPAANTLIFETLGWAPHLKDWRGPIQGERPAAYIVMLGDTVLAKEFAFDAGIAAQTILLGATERGLAGCMIGTVNHKRLSAALALPEGLEIVLVLALGVAAETVVIDELVPGGDSRYWRDEQGVHHVSKRGLSELIIARHRRKGEGA